jgi:hypothetical protein
MTNVYVEARPKGRREGDPIDDYVVEDHADHVLATFKTQHEAIGWSKRQGHSPLVARVRHLNDKKKPAGQAARPRRSGTREASCRRLTGRDPLVWRLHFFDWWAPASWA